MERYYAIPKEKRYVQLTDLKEDETMDLTHSTRDFMEESSNYRTWKKTSDGASTAVQYPIEDSSPQPPTAPQEEPRILSSLMDPSLPDSLFPLHDIAEVLTEARSKEDIFQAILSPFMEFFDRYAIFINKNDVMVGQEAVGDHLTKEKISSIAIPLKVPSIFREVVRIKSPIFGPLPEGHNNKRIASLLDCENGRQPCLLCPIPLVEKVGVIVYADSCQKNFEDVSMRLDKFKKLMDKAGLAFQVLVLKQKILHM
jgi:hypothetical protein